MKYAVSSLAVLGGLVVLGLMGCSEESEAPNLAEQSQTIEVQVDTVKQRTIPLMAWFLARWCQSKKRVLHLV